jgi:hypothetical protein
MTIKKIALFLTFIVSAGVIVIFFNLNWQLDLVGAVLMSSYFVSTVVEDNLRNIIVKLESIAEGVAQGSSAPEVTRQLALIELQKKSPGALSTVPGPRGAGLSE